MASSMAAHSTLVLLSAQMGLSATVNAFAGNAASKPEAPDGGDASAASPSSDQ